MFPFILLSSLFCRTISTGKKIITTIQAELIEKSAVEDFHVGALVGKVFVIDNQDVGNLSLHFDADTGPYITHKDKAFDDGTVVPPRILFTKCSFHENSRRLIGMLDYGGKTIDGSTEVAYEMMFDTKYLCVVSGLIADKKSNEWGSPRIFGDDVRYTNTNQNAVDMDTVKRLEREGATAKTIDVFREATCKY